MSAAGLGVTALGLLAFCISAETVQQVSFKMAANAARVAGGSALRLARHPLVWLGAAIWAVESIAWVQVLQRAPLSLAFPIMTLSYAAVPVAGVLLLGERMSRRQVLGASLIFLGVACVGIAGS
ncbi:EamA family transporter [Phenylobacterium sp.]|uniref:EamA family transporter n=1 Tax=Phenylobacterium sp. TaxID=1871053 RepID=UPI00374C8C17